MAPEQLEGKEADARTDIFALGVVIYEMATGQKAFAGDSKASVIAKILTAQPPPMEHSAGDPARTGCVVQRCLAKKPEDRWQSAAELTSELKEIAETVLPLFKARKNGKEPNVASERVEDWSGISGSFGDFGATETLVTADSLTSLAAWFRRNCVSSYPGSFACGENGEPPVTQPKKEVNVRPLTSYSAEKPLDFAAISPDGKYLAFCSKGKLSLRVIRSGDVTSLAFSGRVSCRWVDWFPDGTKLLLSRGEEGWIQEQGQTNRLPERSLWSLSILGGGPKKIVDHAVGRVSTTMVHPFLLMDRSWPFSRFGPKRRPSKSG